MERKPTRQAAAMKGSAVPGIETGAEGPAQTSATADEAAGRSDTGTGTLTGGAGQGSAGQPASGNGSGRVLPSLPASSPAPPSPAPPSPAPPSPAARPALGGQPGVQDRAIGWLVVAVPAITGLIVGGYRIGYPSLWRDETDTKVVVTRSLGQIFALLHHTDAVHGAYYLIVHVVVGFFGASAGVLRLPSLIAMAIACAFTAAIGRRLTVMAGAPYASFTGLCAGMVFATAPFMTRYAQEARSYAMVTMMATVATYLLLKAVSYGRRWWLAYAVAVAVTGLLNIFGLLLLVAHGLSLLIAVRRERRAASRAATALTRGGIIPAAALPVPGGPGSTRPGGRPESGQLLLAGFVSAGLSGKRVAGLPVRWLAAGAASVAVLIPLMLLAYAQRGQLSWTSRPNFSAIVALARDGSGSYKLIVPIFVLAVGGVLAGLIADRSRRPFTPGVVAFPWMVMPPAVLIGVSLIHPVYDERYVEYCLPALAILVAWGIAWIARLAAVTPMSGAGIGWLSSAVVMLGLASLLIAPQKAIRLDSARPENLEEASAIIASHEQPGDIIFYIPITGRIASMAYPGPFTHLRDIALAKSPVASATLYGTDVSASVLRSRFVDVTRVWVVTGINNYQFPKPTTPVDKEELSLISGMYQIGSWPDGDTLFRLYESPPRIGTGPDGDSLSRLYDNAWG
jgi:mannosyltransferase